MNATPMTEATAKTDSSAEERQDKLASMRNLSNLFYSGAVKIGVHAFIEFTGLMNEYITACAAMEAKGDASWDQANTHSDAPLTLQPWNVKYLGEKLDCIYGPSLRSNPELQAMLLGRALPEDDDYGDRDLVT